MSENLEKILKSLKKGIDYDTFLDKFEMDKSNVKSYIKDLKEKGYRIDGLLIDGDIIYKINPTIERKTINLSNNYEGDMKLGFISDTHYNSKVCHEDELQEYYDIAQSEGVKKVFHAGDLNDGIGVYTGQEFMVNPVGLQDQMDYIVNNYPRRKEIDTYWVEGNHDTKPFKKVGMYIGPIIDSRRDDMTCLGQVNSKVNLDDIILELSHYEGSVAVSKGYRLEKYLRDTKNAPNILLLGHKHINVFEEVRGTYCFEGGAWQGQTPYTKAKNLPNTIGGWIVDVKYDAGVIKRIKAEFLEF